MAKNLNRWIGSYIKQCFTRGASLPKAKTPVHIMFCCCDHYEPDWGKADKGLQMNRVKRWVDDYPKLVSEHKDSDGNHPKHTFFYPAENYEEENFKLLEELVHQGFGEVEIHLHHDQDTEEGLVEKITKAKADFTRHGFLSKRKLSDQTWFGFIHGNWALNNSRKDGRWCGVNDESRILGELGCYADFTYPSAPSETQPKIINSIYYSNSNRNQPKTHNKGKRAQVGRYSEAHLMFVQGPLALNWRNRVKAIFPRIENGDITGVNHPTEDRIDLWVKQRISVKGKPNWIFIKTHTHGAKEVNADALLGEPMNRMYDYLESKYNDGERYKLHYVTAREMFNIIKAAEAGEPGEPGAYRDYILVRNKK